MSFFMALVYDSVMARAEAACLKQWRAELLNQVSGRVLEIGAGTGANIQFYPASVTHLNMTEPDADMRRRLLHKTSSLADKRLTISAETAEQLQASDATYDYVVSSLVCCSVIDLDKTLAEIHRVLKPGGRLVFLEHVAAPEGSMRRRWQFRLNPIWKKLAGNCHLIRETESAIQNAGFNIETIHRESMRKTIPVVRPTIRGIAIKPPE